MIDMILNVNAGEGCRCLKSIYGFSVRYVSTETTFLSNISLSLCTYMYYGLVCLLWLLICMFPVFTCASSLCVCWALDVVYVVSPARLSVHTW